MSLQQKIIVFSIVLLLIGTSGTVYLGQLYYHYSTIALFILSIFFLKNHYSPSKILAIIIICLILMANMLFTQNHDLFAYLALIAKITAVFFILNAINIKILSKYYIYIMLGISLISLIGYVIGLTFPDMIRSSIPSTNVWGHTLRVTPLYIYQDWILDRNNGPYWEPGAYQAFLNLALFITIKLNIKNKPFFVITFILTILTTFSTTGFLVLILVLLTGYLKFQITFKKIIIGLFFCFIFILIESNYGVITEKFNQESESYASYERRAYDLEVALELISDKPIFGWGLNNDSMYDGYSQKGSSNGLLMLGSQFGLFCMFIYMCSLIFIIIYQQTSIPEKVIIPVILFIFFSTENLMFQPIFLALFFLKNEKNNHRGIYEKSNFDSFRQTPHLSLGKWDHQK